LNVRFNGNSLDVKKIDASGRIYVGRDKLQGFVSGQKVNVMLESNNKLVIETEKTSI